MTTSCRAASGVNRVTDRRDQIRFQLGVRITLLPVPFSGSVPLLSLHVGGYRYGTVACALSYPCRSGHGPPLFLPPLSAPIRWRPIYPLGFMHRRRRLARRRRPSLRAS
jgi:hypothetical protein